MRMSRDLNLPSWISATQYRVLARVFGLLEEEGLPYQVTGGLAGNLHGSTWPLHDIDLYVPSEALPVLAERLRALPDVAPEAVRGPNRYHDLEFELDLLQLHLDGVAVDVVGTREAAIRTPQGELHALAMDFARSVPRQVGMLQLHVQPLSDLLAYKRLLGRVADVADLERLAAATGT